MDTSDFGTRLAISFAMGEVKRGAIPESVWIEHAHLYYDVRQLILNIVEVAMEKSEAKPPVDRHHAATRIQCSWRCHRAKRHVAHMRVNERALQKEEERRRAAIVIARSYKRKVHNDLHPYVNTTPIITGAAGLPSPSSSRQQRDAPSESARSPSRTSQTTLPTVSNILLLTSTGSSLSSQAEMLGVGSGMLSITTTPYRDGRPAPAESAARPAAGVLGDKAAVVLRLDVAQPSAESSAAAPIPSRSVAFDAVLHASSSLKATTAAGASLGSPAAAAIKSSAPMLADALLGCRIAEAAAVGRCCLVTSPSFPGPAALAALFGDCFAAAATAASSGAPSTSLALVQQLEKSLASCSIIGRAAGRLAAEFGALSVAAAEVRGAAVYDLLGSDHSAPVGVYQAAGGLTAPSLARVSCRTPLLTMSVLAKALAILLRVPSERRGHLLLDISVAGVDVSRKAGPLDGAPTNLPFSFADPSPVTGDTVARIRMPQNGYTMASYGNATAISSIKPLEFNYGGATVAHKTGGRIMVALPRPLVAVHGEAGVPRGVTDVSAWRACLADHLKLFDQGLPPVADSPSVRGARFVGLALPALKVALQKGNVMVFHDATLAVSSGTVNEAMTNLLDTASATKDGRPPTSFVAVGCLDAVALGKQWGALSGISPAPVSASPGELHLTRLARSVSPKGKVASSLSPHSSVYRQRPGSAGSRPLAPAPDPSVKPRYFPLSPKPRRPMSAPLVRQKNERSSSASRAPVYSVAAGQASPQAAARVAARQASPQAAARAYSPKRSVSASRRPASAAKRSRQSSVPNQYQTSPRRGGSRPNSAAVSRTSEETIDFLQGVPRRRRKRVTSSRAGSEAPDISVPAIAHVRAASPPTGASQPRYLCATTSTIMHTASASEMYAVAAAINSGAALDRSRDCSPSRSTTRPSSAFTPRASNMASVPPRAASASRTRVSSPPRAASASRTRAASSARATSVPRPLWGSAAGRQAGSRASSAQRSKSNERRAPSRPSSAAIRRPASPTRSAASPTRSVTPNRSIPRASERKVARSRAKGTDAAMLEVLRAKSPGAADLHAASPQRLEALHAQAEALMQSAAVHRAASAKLVNKALQLQNQVTTAAGAAQSLRKMQLQQQNTEAPAVGSGISATRNRRVARDATRQHSNPRALAVAVSESASKLFEQIMFGSSSSAPRAKYPQRLFDPAALDRLTADTAASLNRSAETIAYKPPRPMSRRLPRSSG